MPPKDTEGKKPASKAGEKDHLNPDKVKSKKESTQQAQNDESEKDKQIKELLLRVDCLEKKFDLKVFQRSSGSSIKEKDQLALWQGAFKSAEHELIILKQGLPSSGDGNVSGRTDEPTRLRENIVTLEKEIIKRDMAIASIQTKLDEANSALDGMRKQLRPSPKESPRNSSSKSQSSDGNTSAKLASLEKEIKRKDSEMKILKDKITQLKSTAIRAEKEINELKLQKGLTTQESNTEELEQIRKLVNDMIVDAAKEINELKLRQGLTTPDSDKNRPTKLGEVYTELYDNEWTDAYDALTKSGYRDTEAIETLLKTLKACFEFCQSKADQLLESIGAATNVLFQEVHEQMNYQKKWNNTLAAVSKDKRSDVGVFKLFFFKTLSLQCRWKPTNSGETQRTLDGLGTIYQPQSFEGELKRLSKQMSQVLIPVVQNVFLKTYWDDNCIPAIKPFIKKCLFLCWMMVVQGPPMCFDWSTKQGSQLDANLYRHYTGSGTVVEFVVWPALFLHKEGPIMEKGTAQPYVGKNS